MQETYRALYVHDTKANAAIRAVAPSVIFQLMCLPACMVFSSLSPIALAHYEVEAAQNCRNVPDQVSLQKLR